METPRHIPRFAAGILRRAAASLGLAALLASGMSASATIVVGGLQHYATITTACEAASADHSLVLLIFSAEWCGPCQALKAGALDSADFIQKAGNLKIVDVDVDADSQTATKYKVEAVPTLYLLSGDMKIVAHQSGYQGPEALLQWINEGRQRLARGEWEGSGPGGKLAELVKKSATDSLGAQELQTLVQALEDTNPTERATAARVLLAQRERAMPPLINALTNQYLGTRIAAAETLHKLAPASPAIDPWQSPADLAVSAGAVAQWWAATGKLPPPVAEGLDSSAKNSMDAQLRDLLGSDPIRRTEAMSGLVNLGAPVLEPLREAMKRAEKQGNHRAVLAMEEVRWTILISDTLERQIGPIRHTLAQGTSPERQEAVRKLGNAKAIPPLAELAGDPDPLVVEAALRALSKIGGNDAIPAMKALLASADSNLRMTAAQGLGHTRNTNANPVLVTAVNDTDEVVACAALAGLCEINEVERYSSEEKQQSPEVIAAVKRVLTDPRWRVRAAAVETAGKLRATDLTSEIKPLLQDADGFVVKNTLTTLQQLQSAPEPEVLLGISKRLPGLRGEVIEILVENPSEEIITNILAQYDAGKAPDRVVLLRAITKSNRDLGEGKKDIWAPLFEKAAADPDLTVRQAAAQGLLARPRTFAGKPAVALLGDADSQVRDTAAMAVLVVLNTDQTASSSSRRSGGLIGSVFGGQQQKSGKSIATAEKLAQWHEVLAKGPVTNVIVATALMATGDGKADLPVFTAALKTADDKQVTQIAQASILGLVLKKAGWPEAKSLIDTLAEHPVFYALAASSALQVPKEMADYILEPKRFVSALQPLAITRGSTAAELVVRILVQGENYNDVATWALASDPKRSPQIVPLLLQSTNALLRAAGVQLMAKRVNEKAALETLEKALDDPNPWVKLAAVKAFINDRETPESIQQKAIPLLSDTNQTLASMASALFLQPALRGRILNDYETRQFQFEDVEIYMNSSYSSRSEQHPPVLRTNRPVWLPQIKELAAKAQPKYRINYVLLLGQYGDFDLLDQLIAAPNLSNEASDNNEDGSRSDNDTSLFAAIALSKDVKYISYLRQALQNARPQSQTPRLVLDAIQSMNTPEARQLRKEINLKMRNDNSSSFNSYYME
jgi:thioredoxin 1